MSKFLSLVCSAAFVLAASSNVFADEVAASTTTTTTMSTNNKKDKAPFFEQGMPLDVKNARDGKYPMGYNAPASVEVDYSWDMNVSAAFTYWYASQDAMDLAATAAAGATSGSVAYQSFGYAPGFQVGLGFDLKQRCDNWTLNAEYTWYNKTQTGSAAGTATSWAGFTPTATATSSWKLDFNQLDLETGRPFYQGKNVTLAPAGGLRVLWLKQNLALNGATPATSLATSSSSWAIGPKAGVDAHWMIMGGFRVDAMVGSSLLYTRYTTVTSGVSSLASIGAVRPTMDMGLGLGFGSYMFSNKFFFDLSARYDFMQFWNQNMMHYINSNIAGLVSPIGDLQMQGLTLNLRCDF